MIIDYSDAWNELIKMDNILLLTHVNPDGDATGSIFAMYLILKGLGKNVRCITDSISSSLKPEIVEGAYADFDEDFIVTVDVADRKLLGMELDAKYGDRVALSIDHHLSNRLFAEKTLVDSDAAAACEVIYNMLSKAGVKITADVSSRLYTGIATDTGCFRYSNTTAGTLRAAAALVEAGADNGEINHRIFETKSRAYTVFEAMAMNSLRTYLDGKCAVMVIRRSMYTSAGIDERDTQEIKSLPRQIEGVLAGVTICEKSNGAYKISIRSNEPLSAAEICELMGGGGHRLAAGCELAGNEKQVVNTVLKYISQAIAEL